METLAQKINEFNLKFASLLPQDVLGRFAKSIEDLKQNNVGNESLKVGQHFPVFALKNIHNQVVRSDDILRDSKMIVAFLGEVGARIAV